MSITFKELYDRFTGKVITLYKSNGDVYYVVKACHYHISVTLTYQINDDQVFTERNFNANKKISDVGLFLTEKECLESMLELATVDVALHTAKMNEIENKLNSLIEKEERLKNPRFGDLEDEGVIYSVYNDIVTCGTYVIDTSDYYQIHIPPTSSSYRVEVYRDKPLSLAGYYLNEKDAIDKALAYNREHATRIADQYERNANATQTRHIELLNRLQKLG